MNWPIRLVVAGNPVSQKNTKRVGVSKKSGKLFNYTPARVAKYKEDAYHQLVDQRNRLHIEMICVPVICWYAVYRADERSQDLGNSFEAVADELQRTGIVENDSLLIPRARGPIQFDKQNPRIEVTLEPWEGEKSARPSVDD